MKTMCSIFFVLALAGAAAAGDWHIEMVDPDGGLISFTSLALDSSDYPHISYYDDTNRTLKYVRWDGHDWNIETVDSNNAAGMFSSLALDESDYPHISYNCENGSDLRYARWDGAQWRIETVDSEGKVGRYNSLALDSSGNPHISYLDYTNDDLKYAWWNGSSWQIETVDSAGYVGKYTSLALDDSDYPHISYTDFGNENLKYASWDGGSWQIETVDTGRISWVTSLTLDDSDYPHISYHGDAHPDLKYARWNGSFWWICSVETWGVGSESSLKLDSSGNPHISYNDYVNESLKYASWDGEPGVEGAELSAGVHDEGVLVGWIITGDIPASFCVLRSAGDYEPVAVSGSLPGAATRWLDTGAYDASGKGLKPLVYWLETVEADGTVSRFGPSEAVTFPGASRELELAVYPSPASGAFTVDYTLPDDGRVFVALYDLSGRRISTVFDGETAAGRHEFSCDASALPPGVYLVHFNADAGTLTCRVVITR